MGAESHLLAIRLTIWLARKGALRSHVWSARVVSERSERQAAIHHLLLLLRPGGLRADPLLLQREAPSVLQCRHGPRESHILPQCPRGLGRCACVRPLSRMSYISVHKVAYTASQVTATETPYPCLTSPVLLPPPSPCFFPRIPALKPPQASSPPSHFGGSRGGFALRLWITRCSLFVNVRNSRPLLET